MKIILDSNNGDEMLIKALAAAMYGMSSKEITAAVNGMNTKVEEVKEETVEKTTIVSSTKKRKPAKKVEAPVEEKVEETTSKPKEIDINDIRKEMAKLGKNIALKTAIKEELNRRGIHNIAGLQDTDYPEFLEFLKGLN